MSSTVGSSPKNLEPKTARRVSRLQMPLRVWVSLGLLNLLVLAVVFAAPLTGKNPTQTSLMQRLQAPAVVTGNWNHPLGTDELGRDVLARVLFGGQVSLGVGFAASLAGLLLGVGLGTLAAFFARTWVDNLIMYLADVQLSLPFILLAIATALVLGSSPPVVVLLAALAVWPSYARLCYGSTLSLLEREFVVAAGALGGSPWHIARRHILPNLLAPIAVLATLNISAVILLESALSFIGIGIQPPTPSWGNMIGDGREYLTTAPWIVAFPALALVVLTLCIGQIGDWLRDALDVRS